MKYVFHLSHTMQVYLFVPFDLSFTYLPFFIFIYTGIYHFRKRDGLFALSPFSHFLSISLFLHGTHACMLELHTPCIKMIRTVVRAIFLRRCSRELIQADRTWDSTHTRTHTHTRAEWKKNGYLIYTAMRHLLLARCFWISTRKTLPFLANDFWKERILDEGRGGGGRCGAMKAGAHWAKSLRKLFSRGSRGH